MGQLTMGNVGSRDPRLIGHIVVTVLYSLLVYGVVFLTYRVFYIDRIRHLNSTKEVDSLCVLQQWARHFYLTDLWANRLKTTV